MEKRFSEDSGIRSYQSPSVNYTDKMMIKGSPAGCNAVTGGVVVADSASGVNIVVIIT
jgi:hypothetical protein